MSSTHPSWSHGIKGVILDITGVLYESGPGDGTVIPGSVQAVDRLRDARIPVRFCTNETTTTRKFLVEKLKRLGFNLREEEIFAPIPALCQILKERDLRPHLLVHPNCVPEFDNVETETPNCVVLGDAGDEFSYANLNRAFQCLVAMEKPLLFSLGKGKYYRDSNELVLDVGSYSRALEFACDVEAEVVGKPSPLFFNAAVKDMKLPAQNVVMIGDDIVSDVGGAMSCGMNGVLVKTGKFRPQDENHPKVKPTAIVKDLSEAVDILVKANQSPLMDMQ